MMSAKDQILSDMQDLQAWPETYHQGAGRLAIRREQVPDNAIEYGVTLLMGGSYVEAHRRAEPFVRAALAA